MLCRLDFNCECIKHDGIVDWSYFNRFGFSNGNITCYRLHNRSGTTRSTWIAHFISPNIGFFGWVMNSTLQNSSKEEIFIVFYGFACNSRYGCGLCKGNIFIVASGGLVSNRLHNRAGYINSYIRAGVTGLAGFQGKYRRSSTLIEIHV